MAMELSVPVFHDVVVVGGSEESNLSSCLLEPSTDTKIPSEAQCMQTLRPRQYEGQRTASGIYDGEGRLVVQGACQYIGEWKRGARHGVGRYSSMTARVAEAEDVLPSNGKQSRDGRRRPSASGGGRREHIYEGDWCDDKKHGYGRFELSDGSVRYEGEWEEDVIQGLGTLTHTNGGLTYTYEGHWRNQKRHGRGALFWPSGHTWYYGNWNEDKVFGVGMYVSTHTARGKSPAPAVYFGSWSPTGQLLRGFCSTPDTFLQLSEKDTSRRRTAPVQSSNGVAGRRRSQDITGEVWEEVYAILHSLNFESNSDGGRPFFGQLFVQQVGRAWGGLISTLLEYLCNPRCTSVHHAFRIFNLLAHVFNGMSLQHFQEHHRRHARHRRQRVPFSAMQYLSSSSDALHSTPLFSATMPNELEVCRAVLMCLQQQLSLPSRPPFFVDMCCAGLCAVVLIATSSLQARAWLLRHREQFEQMLKLIPSKTHIALELQVEALLMVLDETRFNIRFECFRALRLDETQFAAPPVKQVTTAAMFTRFDPSQRESRANGAGAPSAAGSMSQGAPYQKGASWSHSLTSSSRSRAPAERAGGQYESTRYVKDVAGVKDSVGGRFHAGLFAPDSSACHVSVEDYVRLRVREHSKHPYVLASKSLEIVRECSAGLFRPVVSLNINRMDMTNTIVIDLTDEYHIRACFNISSFDTPDGILDPDALASVQAREVLFLSRNRSKPAICSEAISVIERMPTVVTGVRLPYYNVDDFPTLEALASTSDRPCSAPPESESSPHTTSTEQSRDDRVEVVRHLPGEAARVLLKYRGKLFTATTGNRRHYIHAEADYPCEPIESEYYVMQLYSALGFLVPRSCLYECLTSFNHEDAKQEKPLLLQVTEYIEGKNLSAFREALDKQVQSSVDGGQSTSALQWQQHVWKQLRRPLRAGYIIDCLVLNSEVVSASQRNIVVDNAFRPWRVSFSGALWMESNGRLSENSADFVVDVNALRAADVTQRGNAADPDRDTAEYQHRRLYGLFSDAELVHLFRLLPDESDFADIISLISGSGGMAPVVYGPWLKKRFKYLKRTLPNVGGNSECSKAF